MVPLASISARGDTESVKNSVQSNYLNDNHLGYGLLASVSYKIVFISLYLDLSSAIRTAI